jgi:hypothetical protein
MHPRYLLVILPSAIMIAVYIYSRVLPSSKAAVVWAVLQIFIFGLGAMMLAPIRQIQVVQTRLDEILLRVVTPRPLSTEEEAQLIDTFKDTLKFPHRIGIERVDAIPRRRNFKFEDFLSELA